MQLTADAVGAALARPSAARRLVAAHHTVSDELAIRIARPVRENEITDFEIRKLGRLAVALELGVGSDVDDGRLIVAALDSDR